MQTKNPLLWDFEHSATQDGIVAVFIPFPTPVITRPTMNCAWGEWRDVSPLAFWRRGRGQLTKPLCGPKAVTWMIVPMIMIVPPSSIILRRPRRSPRKKALMAPRNAPTSYTDVTVPWMVPW